MLRVYNCLVVEHDLGLVLIAAAICSVGVAATMMVLSRATQSARPLVWSTLAGLCVSATIWSTHFVAMLAYHPDLSISYDIALTAASFFGGGLVMTAGLGMAVRFRHDGTAVLGGGLLLGAGVVALHYLGMAAVQLAGQLRYDADLVIASLVFSLGFGAAALRVGIGIGGAGNRYLGALLLLFMTVSLHFTAMGATSIQLDPYQIAITPGIDRPTLAIIVAVATIVMLLIGMASVIVDERMSAQMAADAERFRTLADGTFEGIVIHRDGDILDCNRAFREIVGWTDGGLPPSLSAFIAPPALSEFATAPRDPLEITLQRRGGEPFAAEVCGRAIRLGDGSSGQLLAVRDVSARKHVEARLNHLALHDQLTDLPNRRLFIELANKAISQAKRSGRQFAIQVLDLDGFKLINDMHGHEAGDLLLSEVSARLKECLRDEDVVARFGGDEFVILETGTRQPSDAIIVAERLLDRIREPIALPGAEVVIGGSIGISVFPDDGGTIEDLLRNADTAMYRAKADGKGTYRFFESEMDTALMNRRRLESRLRRAVQEQKLDVVYQPLVDSLTQAPLGFEALVRWEDEELGHVSPAQFIPVAEETGLIIALGEYVLHRACADAARWPSPLHVAVNLSAVQFRRHGLVQAVHSALEKSGLAGNRLDLEITESILIENREQVLAILQQLKAMQIHISMDDFGTGYSSLSYLQSFPFDKIKIDRVFISDIQNSHRNSSIIQAVVAMGRSLSMKVVAEGVETPEQASLLGDMRCDELQGFLIARPMPATEIPDFIARQSAHARQSAA